MKKSRKDCFGRLNKVFPGGKNKLREVPPGCFDCIDRKECLRAALNTEEGLEFKSGLIERNRGLGFMDYLKLGIPLNLFVVIASTLLIPLVWPF